MIAKLLLVIFYLLAPAGVLWATRKNNLICRLGPVLTLYILGVVVANVGIFPADAEAHKSFLDFQESVSEVLVPLALPMMLFGCNFRRFSVGMTLRALQPPLASGECRHLHCFSAGGITVGHVICGF